MHPYQNTTISNATIVSKHGEAYSDFSGHEINHHVYVDRPMMNPLQPWLSTSHPNRSCHDQQQQGNNYNHQMYNSNNPSFLMSASPSSAPSISTIHGCMPNNEPYAPLVNESLSSLPSLSSSFTAHEQQQQPSSRDSNPHSVSDSYVISNANNLDDHKIQHNTTMPSVYQHDQAEYISSPSPPHYRSNSIASDSSNHSSLQYQDFEEKEYDSNKRSGGKAPLKKREKALERNRQAALRCRQRKKEWLNQLQSNVEVLTKENRVLEQQSLSLREEILNLKTVLLAHRDCSHAHITASSINYDSLLYRPSSTAVASAKISSITPSSS